MKIYNSLTGKKENLNPLEKDKVKIYVCGMTVYDDCHIGHARTFVCFDMVVRYLRLRNFKVDYVRNITDVDDKIINRAKENGEDPVSLTKRFIKRMNLDFNSLGMLQPDQEPRATENIKIIIDLISRLLELNYAYEVEGDVYFSINSFKDYGKLSNQKIGDIISGARIDVNTKKINPADFTLWKRTYSSLAWDSPWGKGRPGWHIECSAMVLHHLGEQIDIHGGGQDLLFPHHENEIAQSEAALGINSFARFWVHNGLVQMDGDKMSKSLGNVFDVEIALKKYTPDAIRLWVLQSHYRKPLNLDENHLISSEKSISRLRNAIDIKSNLEKQPISAQAYIDKFLQSMNDDLGTPAAIATLFDLARSIFRGRDNNENVLDLTKALKTYSKILGFDLEPSKKNIQISVEEIEELIQLRNDARSKKLFDKSDQLRDKLLSLGVQISDSPEGTNWKRI